MSLWRSLFGSEDDDQRPFPAEEMDDETRLRRRRELIKRVRKLEIITRRVVNDQLAGSYHSVFKGRGMSFDQVRLYQHGDEIRLIDWNVSARMDDIYVKQFIEERELTVFLLVDASASQYFGTKGKSKREAAAEIGAMLAFSAVTNSDRVGLVIFTDEIEVFVPPKKGRKHVLRVISEILEFEPRRTGTNIAVGLDFFSKVCKRSSVAFLLSDFQDAGWVRPLLVASRRHDVIPIALVDPAEANLPAMGTVWVEDPETGEVLLVDTGRRARRRFDEASARLRERREKLFRKLKVDHVRVETDKPFVTPLVNYFRVRAKRF